MVFQVSTNHAMDYRAVTSLQHNRQTEKRRRQIRKADLANLGYDIEYAYVFEGMEFDEDDRPLPRTKSLWKLGQATVEEL